MLWAFFTPTVPGILACILRAVNTKYPSTSVRLLIVHPLNYIRCNPRQSEMVRISHQSSHAGRPTRRTVSAPTPGAARARGRVTPTRTSHLRTGRSPDSLNPIFVRRVQRPRVAVGFSVELPEVLTLISRIHRAQRRTLPDAWHCWPRRVCAPTIP